MSQRTFHVKTHVKTRCTRQTFRAPLNTTTASLPCVSQQSDPNNFKKVINFSETAATKNLTLKIEANGHEVFNLFNEVFIWEANSTKCLFQKLEFGLWYNFNFEKRRKKCDYYTESSALKSRSVTNRLAVVWSLPLPFQPEHWRSWTSATESNGAVPPPLDFHNGRYSI